MSEHLEWLAKQIAYQHVNPPITDAYQPLDSSVLEKALDILSDERYHSLDALLKRCDIKGLHALYQKDLLSPLEVTAYYLRRIKAYNPHLRALISIEPHVLSKAQALKGDPSTMPLYGVPMVIKDNISTATLPNTAGAHALKNTYTKRPATVVRKLMEAGAIILGKANLSEWANFMTLDSSNGYSALGGQTQNPFGPFDVGGSSSGSAVAVASRLCMAALGSETSGSLVYPASQNNVVTIKPTIGLVSRDLIVPISATQDTAGPMARSIEDAYRVLQVISGPDQGDPSTLKPRPDQTSIAKEEPLKGCTMGLLNNLSFTSEYRDNDKEILNQATSVWESLGVKVKPIAIDDEVMTIDMLTVLLYEFKRDVSHYLSHEDVLTDLNLEKVIAHNKADMKNRAAFGQSLLEKAVFETPDPVLYEKTVVSNQTITTRALEDAFKKCDILMSLSNYATATYAASGYPAICIPAGFRMSGEPIGLTLIGKPWSEPDLVRFAHHFESSIDHIKSPNLGGFKVKV